MSEDSKDIQINSTLENVLNTTALNSEGRITIENAAKNDLAFLSNFADIEVSAIIVSNDRISITATLLEPDNEADKSFSFIWDATKGEVIIETEL